MANPIAIPATVVPASSSLIPGGTTGLLGVPGTPGSTTVSVDSGNGASLGTDSKIFVPTPTLANNTKSGLLRQVSGSARDLIDGSNNSAEIEVRSTWKKRYYYAWHCDHPPSTNQTTGVAGTGSVTQIVSQANHPGLYQVTTGGSGATPYAYYASSTLADIQLGFFTKLALRFVLNLTSAPWDIGTQAGYAVFGLTDTLNTKTPGNGVALIYDPANITVVSWFFISGSTKTVVKEGGFSSTSWYDIIFNYDSVLGWQIRAGVWNGNTPPAVIVPFRTANAPASNVNLFWELLVKNAGSSAGTGTVLVDLVEICGELATPGGFRGEELVTAF